MNFKCKYDDFKELALYIEQQADHNSIKITIDPRTNNLFINLHNKMGEEIVIEIYPEELNVFPKITKTYRLGQEIRKK